MNTFICKAKTKNNNTWVTGYYLELGDNGYILPENTSVDNLSNNIVLIDKNTVSRFTGIYDCHKVPIFANDLIVAGQHKCRTITNDPLTREEYCEYAGTLKVIDCGNYYGLDRYEDLCDCFIDGCDEDLGELNQEYFIETFGYYEDAIEKAYSFWYDPTTRKVFN